jgi:virginiamycin B lyase
MAIGRMTTSGSVTTFPLSEGYSTAITAGPDGALWFTVNNNDGPNGIGRITTAGQMTIFTAPSLGTGNWNTNDHVFLWDITSGPNGALWFSMEYASNYTSPAWIGTITTSGAVTTYLIPFAADPSDLTAGPGGAIWFGNFAVDEIGRVTTSGHFSEFYGPAEVGYVLGMAAGPDGAVWFTNYSGVDGPGLPPIGRITATGKITTYRGNRVRGTTDITAGADGAMWFIDQLNDTIGRVSVR